MTSGAQVAEIGRERVGEAARLLAGTFLDDPLMRYLFAGHGAQYRAVLRDVFRYQCELQLLRGWPLLGLVPRSRLAGVLGIAPPDGGPRPPELDELAQALERRIGHEASKRLDRYSDRTSGKFPDAPLHYIRMIGVRPESQGRGYARVLLDAAQSMAEAHPTSTGVALDTENEANVAVYERLGYRVVGRAHLDEIGIWCLFRANGG